MKPYFIIPFIAVCLFACKQEVNSLLIAEDCSGIKETEGSKVISNFYYEKLDSQQVYAVHELQYLKSSDKLPFYTFRQVIPENKTKEFSFFADNFEVQKGLLKTESYSLPGEIAYQLLSLNNGKVILNYTYDLYEASFLDESKVRYVGFYANTACNKRESTLPFDAQTAGFLTLSDRENSLFTYKILCKETALLENLDVGSPTISLRAGTENILDLNSGKTIYFTSDASQEDFVFNVDMSFYTKDATQSYSLLFKMENDELSLEKTGAYENFEVKKM